MLAAGVNEENEENQEIALSDGWPSVAGSVLVNGEVHRSTGPWTPAVHALLRHLERVGFEGSPRVLGFDDQGREVLSWVQGEAPIAPWPAWMRADDTLRNLALLLRRFHDAVAGWIPPEDAVWRRWLGSVGGPIIRHGDLWPSNVVFRSGRPVALIDWEFAQPGTFLDDVASVAKHWVPLVSDEQAAAEGWDLPIDRVRRLRLLCDAYGVDHADRQALIPTVLRNSQNGYLSHKTWGEAGVAGFAEMWNDGSGAAILSDRAWLKGAQPELESFASDG